MQYRAVIHVEMPDEEAADLIARGGVPLPDLSSQLTALTMIASRAIHGALREQLLAPDRVPIVLGVPARITEPESIMQVLLTLEHLP